jgi:arylsulfatase A-like enzyme
MVTLGICILATLLWGREAPASERPNILLLVAEDLSPRIGAFGDAVASTPRLDALAEQGTRYANVFTTTGVCAPSRAALVTGVNAVSIGAQHMRTSSRPEGGYASVPPPHVKAFPELLRAAGYYTYTDMKLDYQFSGTFAGSGPETIWDDEGSETHWRNRPSGQPFFGLVNFQVTHESGVFTPLGSWPHSGTHLLMQLARRFFMGFDPEPVTNPADVVLPPYYPDTETVRRDLARHYDNIAAMDAQVGALLDQLEEDGLSESTLVLWTTDHGDGLPRAKRELYDSGLLVPLIVRWPDGLRPEHAQPGGWDRQLVSFVDLAPTLLAAAGVPAPWWMQGRNFLRASSPPRRFVFAARDRIDAVPDRQRAVRDARFKYVRSWHPDQPGGHPLAYRDNIEMMRELWELRGAGKLDADQRRWFEAPGEERLFDTQQDPFELHDLSQSPEHQGELARMRRALAGWQLRVGDRSDLDEATMAERFWPGGEQPVTEAPQLAIEAGQLTVTNPTAGASSEVRTDGGAWKLVTGPQPMPSGSAIEVRSVRYGWQESEVVSLIVP